MWWKQSFKAWWENPLDSKQIDEWVRHNKMHPSESWKSVFTGKIL
jgi:hypothetical protein